MFPYNAFIILWVIYHNSLILIVFGSNKELPTVIIRWHQSGFMAALMPDLSLLWIVFETHLRVHHVCAPRPAARIECTLCYWTCWQTVPVNHSKWLVQNINSFHFKSSGCHGANTQGHAPPLSDTPPIATHTWRKWVVSLRDEGKTILAWSLSQQS